MWSYLTCTDSFSLGLGKFKVLYIIDLLEK